MKSFKTSDNGRKGSAARYYIRDYDGIQTHKDGSPFWGLRIFKNKKDFSRHVNFLLTAGYREQGFSLS